MTLDDIIQSLVLLVAIFGSIIAAYYDLYNYRRRFGWEFQPDDRQKKGYKILFSLQFLAMVLFWTSIWLARHR